MAANGDTANKIGTYQIAVLAKHHSVPFYIAAPFTSIDMKIPSGDHIVIEERPDYEMTHVGEHRIAAKGMLLPINTARSQSKTRRMWSHCDCSHLNHSYLLLVLWLRAINISYYSSTMMHHVFAALNFYNLTSCAC